MWIYMDQALDVFKAIKTNDYIPYFKDLSGRNRPSEWAARLGLNVFSSNITSCIFDYLMVHRCYVIWGYSKSILYPFAFVMLVTDVTAFVAAAMETAAYQHQVDPLYMRSLNINTVAAIISVIYSSLLTLLTGSWSYLIFVATILESGLLFSATQVVGVVLPLITDPHNKGLIPLDFSVINVQMASIAQTVIIIRIAYGQAIESVQQVVSTLQFAEGANHSPQHSTAAHCTVNLQQSLTDIEERGTVGRIETGKPPLNMKAGDVVDDEPLWGHLGSKFVPAVAQPSGKYIYSPAQLAVLRTKRPTYLATPQGLRTKTAAKIYDWLIINLLFKKPEKKTAQQWKDSLMCRYRNNKSEEVEDVAMVKMERKASGPKSIVKQKGKRGNVMPKTKALTELYNKLVHGTLTMKTGREAFGEAHTALVEWTMIEENDSNNECVPTQLWEELSPESHQHWEGVAIEQSPILQNQEGFVDGFRVLAQSCLQSKLLGCGSIAVVICFDKETVTGGIPVTETRIINEWSDPNMSIPDSTILEDRSSLMTSLHQRLPEHIQQSDVAALNSSTEFPVDDQDNPCFLYVNVEDLSPTASHEILPSRLGPVWYTEIPESPQMFYDPLDLPFGTKILNPADMSRGDIGDLTSHFVEDYRVKGRVFVFFPPSAVPIALSEMSTTVSDPVAIATSDSKPKDSKGDSDDESDHGADGQTSHEHPAEESRSDSNSNSTNNDNDEVTASGPVRVKEHIKDDSHSVCSCL
ncbi:hypothetical protein PQX77_013899 [Marasmius sp. AFHP31]|nr:hypothetical protein PQX77_013899 [Marasmius sp. AFHP31]